MEFGFSQDTVMLKDNAGRFLKEKCSSSAVKNMLKEEKSFSRPCGKKWQISVG